MVVTSNNQLKYKNKNKSLVEIQTIEMCTVQNEVLFQYRQRATKNERKKVEFQRFNASYRATKNHCENPSGEIGTVVLSYFNVLSLVQLFVPI